MRPAAASAPADPRVARVADEVRQRLRPSCGGWDEAEFEAVVQCIARTKVRWADAGYEA